jgi:hypothetical protein
MALINISDFSNSLDIGSSIEIKFKFKNSIIHKLPKFLVNEYSKDKKYISKRIEIIDFLGQGSYGSVFKIKINDKYYALKLSENELPNKLLQRYKSLCQNENLKRHVIKIYCCGEISTAYESKYNYYCIMEFGGNTLKSVIHNLNLRELKFILVQLYNIVHHSCKYRLLITDFKLGNLTITSKNKIKLIDIYMECFNYSPCEQCKIVKTYSTIELDKEKRIYENPNYNYTGIYIPLAVSLIELICSNSLSHYTGKLCKKFNIDLTVKQMIPILQIACFNYLNNNNKTIDNMKNVKKFKKNLENEFKILKNNDFYEYFLNLLEPKEKYNEFINKKKFNLIINDLLTLDPDRRSLKHLKECLLNTSTS